MLRRWKWLTRGGAISVAILMLVSIIKVEVPANLRGPLVAHGRISHCDFQSIGLRGGEFFLGVTLDAPEAPYLRFNARISEREFYEDLCARKPTVRITYRAIKRVLGPVGFWIDRVTEVQPSTGADGTITLGRADRSALELLTCELFNLVWRP